MEDGAEEEEEGFDLNEDVNAFDEMVCDVATTHFNLLLILFFLMVLCRFAPVWLPIFFLFSFPHMNQNQNRSWHLNVDHPSSILHEIRTHNL